MQNLTQYSIVNSARKTLAERSFFHFIRMFWPAVVAEVPVWNWHIQYLCDVLQRIAERVKLREPAEFDYVIINVPPGSSKSTIVSIFYPIWCWIIDPTQRFICASYAEDIALDHANKATRILNDDTFKLLFPELEMRRMALSHMENSRGGERYTAATGSAVTGKHAHQIIIDDPLNPKKAASEVEIKTANSYVAETLSTRKVDKAVTPTLVIMQRLHEQDTTGFLLGKRSEGLRVLHICLPAELSRLVQPAELAERYVDGLLDPVRLSADILRQQRVTLGSYGYAGQMGQNPTPEGGGILKAEWFSIVDRPIPTGATIHFRLDTAYTDKQKNDPTGILAYYMGVDGYLYVTNYTTRRMEFPELVEYIPEHVRLHGYSPRSLIWVEPKASGKSVVQSLKSIPGLNVMEGPTPKDDKPTRARAISAKCEAGKVRLHRGAWNEAFLQELAIFPNGAHDEAVDVLVEAVKKHLIVDASDYGYRKLS